MNGRPQRARVGLLNLSADPSGGTAGEMYFNTTLHQVRVHNGTAWKTQDDTSPVFVGVASLPAVTVPGFAFLDVGGGVLEWYVTDGT